VIWFHRDSSKREYFVVISPGWHRHINNRLHRQSNVWSYSHLFKIPVNRLPHSRGEGTRFHNSFQISQPSHQAINFHARSKSRTEEILPTEILDNMENFRSTLKIPILSDK
jgi:hypothetical protein